MLTIKNKLAQVMAYMDEIYLVAGKNGEYVFKEKFDCVTLKWFYLTSNQ